MIRLECLGARHGDCIVMHHEKGGKASRILFDGGPSGVYSGFLKPWLEGLGAAAGDAPDFTLGMVTHIDDDHINGILALMRECVKAKEAGKPPPARFDRFWFNSFSGLTAGGHVAANTAAVTASLDAPDFDPDSLKDSRSPEIIASVRQGHDLSNALGKLGLGGNAPFNGLVAGAAQATVVPGLTFKVLAPLQNRIADLQEKWNKEIPPETIAEFADKTVPNLSSIVILAESDGKKVLMTGDARGDDILEGLESAGFPVDGTMMLDVLKLPHHGSSRNVTTGFFAAIPARIYVISADGEHDNPDAETLEMLFEARGSDAFEIVFASPQKTSALQGRLVKQLEDAKANGNFTWRFREDNALSIMVDV